MNKKYFFIAIVGLVLFFAVATIIVRGGFLIPNANKAVEFKYMVTITNGEWEPYFSEKLENYGVVSHIVEEAFAKEGVMVEYVFLPWNRGLEESSQGKWNGTMGWGKTPEREENFIFSDKSILITTSTIFYLKDKGFDWATISDLEGVKIAGTEGYFYGDEIEAAEKSGQVTIERSSDEKIAFKKLINGRVDVVIADREVGYELVRSLFTPKQVSQITHHEKAVDEFSTYLLLNKKDENSLKIMKLFNKGHQKLINSGKVDQYWEKSKAGEYKIE